MVWNNENENEDKEKINENFEIILKMVVELDVLSTEFRLIKRGEGLLF